MSVTVSVMDRLLADISGGADDFDSNQMQLPSYSKSEYREHVRRDLELLLNTPRTPLSLSGMSPLAARTGVMKGATNGVMDSAIDSVKNDVVGSVLGYGVPDLTALNFSDPASVSRYCQSLKALIEKHEPRFEQVQVQLMPPESLGDPYRLSIQAALRMNPAPEIIAFDSELMPGGQRIELSASVPMEMV